MEEILLENDLAYDDESNASERLNDVEKNIADLSAKESAIDEVYGEWLRAKRHDVDTNADRGRREDARGVKYYHRPADESRSATIYSNYWQESTQMGWTSEGPVTVGVWCPPQVHRLSGVPAATTLHGNAAKVSIQQDAVTTVSADTEPQNARSRISAESVEVDIINC